MAQPYTESMVSYEDRTKSTFSNQDWTKSFVSYEEYKEDPGYEAMRRQSVLSDFTSSDTYKKLQETME